MSKLALWLLLLPIVLYAQPDTLWTWTTDLDGPGLFTSVELTADGGYVVGGYGPEPTRMSCDIWFHKLNVSGVPVWNRLIDHRNNEGCDAMLPTSDGGYLLVGSFWDTDQLPIDILAVKTDATGDTLWCRLYRHFEWNDEWEVNGIVAVPDGGYAMVGTTVDASGISYDAFLMRIAENGDSLWTRQYGGVGGDYGNDILTVDDGYAIVGGRSRNVAGDVAGPDCWLVRTNAIGDTLWTRSYRHNNDYWNNGIRICRAAGGGYVICGVVETVGYGNSDAWLIRTDENGDTLWTRCYSGPGEQSFNDVQLTMDGCYLAVGHDNSSALMVKYDSAGNTVWSKTVDMGGEMSWLMRVRQTPDSGYIAAGKNDPIGAPYATGFVLKTTPDAMLAAEPDHLLHTMPQTLELHPAYPNPFNAVTTLSFSLSHSSSVTLTVFDLLGQVVYETNLGQLTTGVHRHLFNANDLPSGVYLARVQAGKESQMQKIVLLK